MRYRVTFSQYSVYEVEAANENDAIDIAYKDFNAEMSYPVARTIYDDVEAEELDDEEEENTL